MTNAKETSGTSDEPVLTAPQILRAAHEQFTELTGLRPEGVSRFERAEQGWLLEAEVVEITRVPETMSVMALYEVTLDATGLLTGYRRVRRYERGRTDSR
ncbi:gas vesicle protein GvpO [Streptomyces cinnamoneus]|uniref:Gas vesicle protein n=1 Tax=Streptomyces cinnamoneus TaxID=53446 RepID=A0A918WDW1_STRCJ|nr:gas vesicle protein GvpO [Streptomyces cinnamoneus]GHC34535.1 gas vesicle protein [Streptomyces cinnamoneus]